MGKHPPLKLPAGAKTKKRKPLDIRGDIYHIYAVCTGGMAANSEKYSLQGKGFKVLVRKVMATKKRPTHWLVYRGPKKKRR